MGEEFKIQRATKIAASGFPVAVGGHRTIELMRRISSVFLFSSFLIKGSMPCEYTA